MRKKSAYTISGEGNMKPEIYRAVCCTWLDRQIDMHRAIRSWVIGIHGAIDGYS